MFFLILLLASNLGDLLDFEIFRQETIFRTLGIIFFLSSNPLSIPENELKVSGDSLKLRGKD